MAPEAEIDVLIVGAGPVGLFLANECARRGMTHRIIESHATQSSVSKALAIFPRTLEIFDMAGIAGAFSEVANRVTGVTIVSHKRTLGRIDFTPPDTRYPFVAMVPQDVTEKLLVENLTRLGAKVEYETTLVSAHQTDTGVEAIINCHGTSAVIEAKFLVGCDGAHSTVRNLVGLPFDGGDYAEQYMLADVVTNEALPADELQLCPSEQGPLAIFPMSPTRRRLVATVDERDGEAPSLDLVRTILADRAPAGLAAESLNWSAYFKIHHRSVSRMSSGRVIVAGDAAHIHSPFGGQGMNTGLQDVWNLVWKLDFAAQGKATDELLKSYSEERHPIVRAVIETTHVLTSGLGSRSPLVQGIRNTVIPVATHIPMFRRAFVERLSGLGNSYKGSPIVEGAGRRYSDLALWSGSGTGRRFMLLARGENDAATSLESRFSDLLDVRLSDREGLILIRPDGYVAYESPETGTGSFSVLEAVLSRQIGNAVSHAT